MKEALAKGLIVTSRILAGLASMVDAKTVHKEAVKSITKYNLEVASPAVELKDDVSIKPEVEDWKYNGYL